MPFILANFQPIGGQSKPAKSPGFWAFKTADAITAVRVAGYFNPVRDLLNIGDVIYVAVVTNLGASNEALSTASHLVVKDKPAGGNIDTTDQTALTVTDTD